MSATAIWQLLLPVLCALCRIVAGDSCAGVPLPPLPGCFTGQPVLGFQSCYRIVQVNGSDVVKCAYSAPGSNEGDVVSICNKGQWDPGNINSCKAAPRSAWRLVSGQDTLRGWWLHELQFHSDSSCRKALAPGSVRLEFATGPSGPSSASPRAAFDGDISSVWRAPCAGSSSFDFCGCRRDFGEGWSIVQKRCVPASVTNGNDEKDCLVAGAGNASVSLGCPAGGASLGIHLAASEEIACVRILPYGTVALSTPSVILETWSDGVWQVVKRFAGLKSETWNTLYVKDACPIYILPNYASKWTRIVGMNSGGAGDGDSLDVACIDGSKDAQVTCKDGAWSKLPMISCFQPSMPLPPPRPGNALRTAAKEDDDMDEGVEMILWLFGCVGGVLAVLGFIHVARIYMQRQAWKELIKYGAKPPEPKPVVEYVIPAIPKLRLNSLQGKHDFPTSMASPHKSAIMQSPTSIKQTMSAREYSMSALENGRASPGRSSSARGSPGQFPVQQAIGKGSSARGAQSARSFSGPPEASSARGAQQTPSSARSCRDPPEASFARGSQQGPSSARSFHGPPETRGPPAPPANVPVPGPQRHPMARGPPVAHGPTGESPFPSSCSADATSSARGVPSGGAMGAAMRNFQMDQAQMKREDTSHQQHPATSNQQQRLPPVQTRGPPGKGGTGLGNLRDAAGPPARGGAGFGNLRDAAPSPQVQRRAASPVLTPLARDNRFGNMPSAAAPQQIHRHVSNPGPEPGSGRYGQGHDAAVANSQPAALGIRQNGQSWRQSGQQSRDQAPLRPSQKRRL